MKSFYILMLFVAFIPASFAQGKYKPGYVINLKGDTIHGLISYSSLLHDPKVILFKLAGGKEQTLTASDVDFFHVDKVDYKSFKGRISLDPVNPDHLTTFIDTGYRLDTVFVRLIQKGKNLLLYSYADNIKIRFYITEDPRQNPEELIYKRYWDSDNVTLANGRTVIVNTYMKQLYALAIKYNALDQILQRDIEDADYRKYYLKEIVEKINQH